MKGGFELGEVFDGGEGMEERETDAEGKRMGEMRKICTC